MIRSKNILARFAGIAMSVCMIGASVTPAYADVNPTSKTIPVTASLDNYYEVVIPAGLDGDGVLRLTQEFNDIITSDGDNGGTFYGYLPVSIKGYSSSGVHTYINCPNLALMRVKDQYAEETTKTLDMYEAVSNGYNYDTHPRRSCTLSVLRRCPLQPGMQTR